MLTRVFGYELVFPGSGRAGAAGGSFDGAGALRSAGRSDSFAGIGNNGSDVVQTNMFTLAKPAASGAAGAYGRAASPRPPHTRFRDLLRLYRFPGFGNRHVIGHD
jgi:hypothetical protein